jgi:hypothetical protein
MNQNLLSYAKDFGMGRHMYTRINKLVFCLGGERPVVPRVYEEREKSPHKSAV